MRTISWKSKGWRSNQIEFHENAQLFGSLTFDNSWNWNASYHGEIGKIDFKSGIFLQSDQVKIYKHGEHIGSIHRSFLGGVKFIDKGQSIFYLNSNIWDTCFEWKNSDEETIIQINTEGILNSGSGTAEMILESNNELDELLIASSIYVKHLDNKKRALLVAALVPLIAAINHL